MPRTYKHNSFHQNSFEEMCHLGMSEHIWNQILSQIYWISEQYNSHLHLTMPDHDGERKRVGISAGRQVLDVSQKTSDA